MGRFVVVVMVLALGCSKGGARGTPGTERGDCRSGDDKCEPGLLCLSNLCVRPPAADCALVSETLASLDLGNYAEPEERAPVVTKYKAACEKAHVSKEEGECLDKARDKWSAGQCAPRMFPEMTVKGGDCKVVAAKLESTMKQLQGANDNPQMAQYLATMAKVVGESCVEDAWPDAVKQCILMQSGGADAMQVCNQQFPPALQTKLQERLQTAMREQMK